jgi:RNA polymerase sigma-70 factor (ECF subfamily)
MDPKEPAGWAQAPRHFQPTHWSLVLAAGQGAIEPERAQAALAELCRIYWFPVYGFIRYRRSQEQARDLTQEFFARQLELDSFRHVRPEQGRFRSWLLQAVKNFLSNARKFDTAQKRDSRLTLGFDGLAAEERYSAERSATPDPERAFMRRSTLALLEHVLQALREQYQSSGRGELFAELSGFLPGEHQLSEPVYDPIATRLGMTRDAVKAAVYRLRQDYGKLFHDWLRAGLHDPAAVQEEIQCMLDSLRVPEIAGESTPGARDQCAEQ